MISANLISFLYPYNALHKKVVLWNNSYSFNDYLKEEVTFIKKYHPSNNQKLSITMCHG